MSVLFFHILFILSLCCSKERVRAAWLEWKDAGGPRLAWLQGHLLCISFLFFPAQLICNDLSHTHTHKRLFRLKKVERRRGREVLDFWSMMIRFMIGATCDVLPSPQNLSQRIGEDAACPLCYGMCGLRHAWSGCKISFSQGCYTCCPNHEGKYLVAEI